jgi:hypothetical protein
MMIILKKEHKQRLERAKHNRFLDECVARLKELDLPNAYPSDQKLYREFVKAGYENAKLYGMDDFPHHTYAYMVAWHSRGGRFIQHDKEILLFFSDAYIPSFAKFEKLLEMIGNNENAIIQIREMM